MAVLVLAAIGAAPAQAQLKVPLQEVGSGDVRIDGALGEWRGQRFGTLGEGANAALRYAFGYDAEGLYVALEVADDRLVRTARARPDEDAVVVTLAVPDAHGANWKARDVWLLAGVPGRLPSRVRVGPVAGRARMVKGVRVVEGPRHEGAGYVLEAFLPWRRLVGRRAWQRGRLAVRLRDVDAPGQDARELASSPVSPHRLDALPPLAPSGGSGAALEALRSGLGLQGQALRHDLSADVSADGRPERIVVIGTRVAVLGPTYGGGQGFEYLALPIALPGDLQRVKLRDLTGDGKAELVCVLRQRNDLGSRDLWQVIGFAAGPPRPLWAIEVRKATEKGFAQAHLEIHAGGRGQPPRIVVEPGRVERLTQADLTEDRPVGGVAPILLPWGAAKRRIYQWNGSEIVLRQEVPRAKAAKPASGSPRRETPAEPEAPSAPSAAALLKALRAQLGIPARVRARFTQQANLAGDGSPEQLGVLGQVLYAVGAAFGGYAYLQLPVRDDGDVLAVHAADLTGDGHEEAVVRLRQVLEGHPDGPVIREVLFVHQLGGAGVRTLLAVEVARRQGRREIRNQVRLAGGKRGVRLRIEPGRAKGWGSGSYTLTSTEDGIRPLLLPWRDQPVRFRGETLVPVE